MSSRSASTIASNQRPTLHIAPEASESFGDLAATFASDYGLTPDPWQQLVLDDWLAELGGRYAALTCGCAVARQNGKNGILEIRELFGMVGRGEKILHTAHEVKTARKAFKRLQHFFGRRVDDPGAKFPELNALVTELRNVNGQEAIFLRNGGSVEIAARSQGSARGWTVDVLVMDEAQDLSDDDLEALMPTTSSAPLGNPQWIFTGTPPGPRANGEVFTRTRMDALKDRSHRLAWHEWSLDAPDLDAVDLDDRDLWYRTNPALGGRLQLDVIEGERSRFSPEGFARERLGWWAPAGAGGGAIDPLKWASLVGETPPRGESVVFALDVAPDHSTATLAAAWLLPDGSKWLQLADHRPGVEWVPERCADLVGAWHGRVLVEKTGTAAFLLPKLPAADEVPRRFYADACSTLEADVTAGAFRHGNQPELNASVAVARWSSSGDAGQRVLSRKDPRVSPLVAAAIALHALTAAPAETDFFTI